ncbi:hypothetical protein IU433_31045 [Nocardia puris]|uniref:hypothetical protein n=1 Tax=Nocardia puris TaxID=208602 RepID=UPI000A695140|nr:hypothetical protein [Nocardia puris]MBF6215368.1 hypothetical protein [Nocardia puris]MBF6369778.1 hypothetical protein [Nocardia puris]MBF6463437.1 hypothetical protein [Nocardia puris]
MTEGTPAQRLRLALQMSEFGVQMYRTRMRRIFPAASTEEIESKVHAWLLSRPGAPAGDATGRPSTRFA